MDKVLVEKARRGGNKFRSKTVGAYRHSKKMDEFVGEGTHSKSTSKIVGWERKELNENLNPLKRFLHSRIGKKWDDVYSEICSRIDKKNAVQGHIIQHLFQYVEIDHRYQNGYAAMWRYTLRRDNYVPDFYVDINGILQKGKKDPYSYNWKAERDKKISQKYRKVGDEIIILVSGIWYFGIEATVRKEDTFYRTYKDKRGNVVPYAYYEVSVKDFIFPDAKLKIGDNYVSGKGKQLNSEEIKRFGVSNEMGS